MGWAIVLLLALIVAAALWRLGGLRSAALQLVGAALCLGLAGYAVQGRPGLAGKPMFRAARAKVPDTVFAALRGKFMAQFSAASRWLTISEHYHRTGKTEDAVAIIQSGLREHPYDPDLWIGLGNALMVHSGGTMTPAAELAFRRANELGPNLSGVRFFTGMALAQVGRLGEAEAIWRRLLATAPADAEWRGEVAARLRLIEELKRPQPPQ